MRGSILQTWRLIEGVKDSQRVMLDVAGYRARRVATLERLAKRTAERAMERRRPIRLEPMSAADRRIIHVTLQGHPDVETNSEGREPYRRVIVSPTKGKEA